MFLREKLTCNGLKFEMAGVERYPINSIGKLLSHEISLDLPFHSLYPLYHFFYLFIYLFIYLFFLK